MAKKKQKKKPPAKEAPVGPEPMEIDPDLPVEQQVPLNELPTHFPNAYEAVVAAARRARQLNLGLRPLVKTKMYRPVDVALAELAAGKVEYTAGDEESVFKSTGKKGKSRGK
jgi:DNA-directed RNA polymerase omega subunit